MDDCEFDKSDGDEIRGTLEKTLKRTPSAKYKGLLRQIPTIFETFHEWHKQALGIYIRRV